MSFGMQVFSSNGSTILDTRNKRFYTLHGRLVSKTYPYDSWIRYLKIPARFTPLDTILVMRLENWRGSRSIWSVGPNDSLPNVGEIRYSWAGTRMAGENYPQIEMYVYTLGPAPTTNDYGIQIYNEIGEVQFNTESSSLKIVEQVNRSTPGLGKIASTPIQGPVGIIISANPYYAQTGTQGYVTPELGMYRVDDSGFVEQRLLRSSNLVYMYGNVQFSYTSVATVQLPANAPPIIPW